MTERRFSLEEVERAYLASWTDSSIDNLRWRDLEAALNALPEEPDLLEEAMGLLRRLQVREMDFIGEHTPGCICPSCGAFDDVSNFLAKVKP